MDEVLKNQIALFRYGIIAPLVTKGETSPQERGDFFRDAAEKEYRHPDGRTVSVSSDTVYRYFRKYSEGGFDALRPVGRSDLGKTRKLSDDITSQIIYLHREYPRLPCTLIYQKLLDNGTITEDTVSLSTITRFVSNLKKEELCPGKEMRRYELAHINEVWYGDSSAGPYLRDGNNRIKTWIIALIDDASRMIVGIGIFTNDNYVNLLAVIRSAVIRYGKPKTLKFDNGASYRSHQMELLGARMGTAISYAPPRTPAHPVTIGGKTEWVVGSSSKLSKDAMTDFLNKIQADAATELGITLPTPQDRFFEESSLIYRFDEDRINKTFLLEDERTVSADNVIVIENKEYEVDYKYAGRRLLIRYSADLSKIYSVDRKTGEMEEIHLLDKYKNSLGHRKTFRYSNDEAV